jgi:hypothetical protein
MANFLAFVIPDFAKAHDDGAYDPCEKLVCVEVVLRPSAITVD